MTDAYPAANPGPRIPQSYADELGLFSHGLRVRRRACGLRAPRRGRRRAERLAGPWATASSTPRSTTRGYSDGRLRQAYNVGPYIFYDGNPQPYGFVRPDGSANIGSQFGFLGTAVGDMAWPGIALVQLYRRTRKRTLPRRRRPDRHLDHHQHLVRPVARRLPVRRQRRERTDPERLDRAQHRLRLVLRSSSTGPRGDRDWLSAARRTLGVRQRMWSAEGGSSTRDQRRRHDQPDPRSRWTADLELARPARPAATPGPWNGPATPSPSPTTRPHPTRRCRPASPSRGSPSAPPA